MGNYNHSRPDVSAKNMPKNTKHRDLNKVIKRRRYFSHKLNINGTYNMYIEGYNLIKTPAFRTQIKHKTNKIRYCRDSAKMITPTYAFGRLSTSLISRTTPLVSAPLKPKCRHNQLLLRTVPDG